MRDDYQRVIVVRGQHRDAIYVGERLLLAEADIDIRLVRLLVLSLGCELYMYPCRKQHLEYPANYCDFLIEDQHKTTKE